MNIHSRAVKTWKEQQYAEKRALNASRREWLATLDHLTPAEAARHVRMDPTSLHRIMRQTGYKWRGPNYTPPAPVKRTLQPTVANVRRGMTPAQRAAMDRAIDAGMRPAYAAAEAFRILA